MVSALLGGAASAPAAGQIKPPAPADTAHTARHELGLTASPVLDHFFTANRSLPVGLLYKHGGGAAHPDRATRWGLTFSQQADSFTDNRFPPVNQDRATADFALDALVGREYRRTLGRRWRGAAGADLGVGYARTVFTTSRFLSTAPLLRSDTWTRYNTYSAQVRPFVALHFRLTPCLYVAAESSAQVFYQHQILAGYDTLIDYAAGTTTPNGTSDYTYRTWRVQFQLVRQLTLHYALF